MQKRAVRERMQISKIGTCNNKNGFTLLELVLVIFIISISAAIVFPSFSVFETAKIKSDAKKIASILRYLNENAITTKETSSLKIDFKKKRLIYNSTEDKKEEIFETIRSAELQSQGMVFDGEVTLFFHHFGAAENINIYLSDNKSSLIVAFNHLSGRVKIIEQ